MKVNYKKLIVNTILWTLTASICLCAIISLIMFLAFPKTLGNLFYSLGQDNIASTLYYKVYQNEGDINYCHKALTLKIKIGNDAKIKEYFETFRNDENYANYLSALKEEREKSNLGILEKSAILNEENFLMNKYLNSLINLHETNQAYDLAIELFRGYKDFTLFDQGIFALNLFVNIDNFGDFSLNHSGYEKSIIGSMEEYFNVNAELFDSKKETSDSLEKAYLVSLGNRLIIVGQTINKYNSNINNTNDIEIMNNKLIEINNIIKGLV